MLYNLTGQAHGLTGQAWGFSGQVPGRYAVSRWVERRAFGVVGTRPNNSFKPKTNRYAIVFGLIQALGAAVRTSPKAIAALLAVLAIVGSLPGILYVAALWQVDGRPRPLAASSLAASEAWQDCREPLPLRVQPLNPWGETTEFLFGDLRHAPPGSRAAWAIARNYNSNHLNGDHVWWHPSGAAMTIWITRNWSADQIASTAAAGGYCRAAPNNSFKPKPLRGSA
jgi:hypothetical protein